MERRQFQRSRWTCAVARRLRQEGYIFPSAAKLVPRFAQAQNSQRVEERPFVDTLRPHSVVEKDVHGATALDEASGSVVVASVDEVGGRLPLDVEIMVTTPASQHEGYEVSESSFHQQQADPIAALDQSIITRSSIDQTKEKMAVGADGSDVALPSLAMTGTSSSTEDNLLQMVSSSASSSAVTSTLTRIRDEFDLPEIPGSNDGGRVPWYMNALPRPSKSQQSTSSTTTNSHGGKCSSQAAPGVRSLVDAFSVVTRDFLQNYSCTNPAPFGRSPETGGARIHQQRRASPTWPSALPRQQQQRDDVSSDPAEEIEFDETEILRRDYELSRV